ncbi:RM10 protein, partial [Pachycephala philippinensis]|nr:RM10 protein [Pachycephala philippinensis]
QPRGGPGAGAGAERCPAAWLPALQLLRRGSKAVTRHWKAMHLQRQKLLAVTEYLPPRPAVPPRCLPRPAAAGHEEDGQARVLRRQLEETLRGSRMLAVCQYNSMPDEDVVTLQHFLRRHNIHVKFVLNEVGSDPWRGSGVSHCFHASSQTPSQVARPVLAQSKYRNLLPLFVCRNVLLVSPETRAREMLRVLKGVPQVNLLGACIDDTILSWQGVENFARLPPLEVSQGQTVAALSLLSSQTSSLLQRGPAHLTALLDEHIRRLRDAAGPTEPPPGRSAGNH